MLYIISAIPMGGGLSHHGIKGQKWGVRRWQNADGSLTEAGKKRYYREQDREEKRKKVIESVRKYDKAFDKADTLQEIADRDRAIANAEYKRLGSTKLSKKITKYTDNERYEKYCEAKAKAILSQAKADYAYKEMRIAYQNTGKNYLTRVFNNVKYGN